MNSNFELEHLNTDRVKEMYMKTDANAKKTKDSDDAQIIKSLDLDTFKQIEENLKDSSKKTEDAAEKMSH